MPSPSLPSEHARMETATVTIDSHSYAEARRLMSQCWIYTKERGLCPMTMHGNGSAVAIDGQRLLRWCILDDAVPRSIIAYVYSAEKPSPELRQEVAESARDRFFVSRAD